MSDTYRSTLLLPQTSFEMKAGLPKKEPGILAEWEKNNLCQTLQKQNKGHKPYVLHDGPPYANGHIHLGTALNKILKDVVTRCQRMLGRHTYFVPGWDCHGLPIEWEIEARYRKAGKNKDDINVIQFRQECRSFAQKWVEVQKEEFKRLGVMGDWDHPYLTMDYAMEAAIVAELYQFLFRGYLYRGEKPVLWSVVEKTALAEAEIEYRDHRSNEIYVVFPIKHGPDHLKGAKVVIWTTTPWTIPGNRAVAFSPASRYSVFRVTRVGEDALAKVGDRLVVSQALAQQIQEKCHITEWVSEADVTDCSEIICYHPLHRKGYDFDVPLLAGEHVTDDAGTGFVHTAPGHGEDDFKLGLAHNLEVPRTVNEEGIYYDSVPLFAGKRILQTDGKPGDADLAVTDALRGERALLAHAVITHSYPHSWRSKAPLIFRTTPQWFIRLDHENLRIKALQAIDNVKFVPERGRHRLRSMIELRPDWCVSRQRVWGVPIALFVHKQTGEPLKDKAIYDEVIAKFHDHGCDPWFTDWPEKLLAKYQLDKDYQKVSDVLDVWFDSGTTHNLVLGKNDDLPWPADLYLEGSDQHRGWFQHSLLEACGTKGQAPFRAILTHGFVVDEKGYKMSKSLGNVISPQEIIDQHGADVLRLWVVGSDYSEDLRIGKDIIAYQVDIYRRLRNTLRFLLGNLHGFSEKEKLPIADMPMLERWVLHSLTELNRSLQKSIKQFDFHDYFTIIHNFCTNDLSAFYFDIRKDSLYCDNTNAPRRRAARSVMDILFDALVTWLAPFIPFTAEEAWQARYHGTRQSVHEHRFHDVPDHWFNENLGNRWSIIKDVRRVINGAIELKRAQKVIGSSLQACPIVYTTEAIIHALDQVDLAEVAITSRVGLMLEEAPADAYTDEDIQDIAVVVELAEGQKCERCWKVLPEVGASHPPLMLCDRCYDVANQDPSFKKVNHG